MTETVELTRGEAEPPWARGVSLEFLKEAAAIFRAHLKPHCYGAFGLPKERDVADAKVDGGLAWAQRDDGKLAAVAIAKRLSRPSPHKDFAERTATLQAGDLFIRAIAGDENGCKRIIEGLAKQVDPDVVWVEAHVEEPVIVEVLAQLGFERVMTKIAASSDLKGLYAWFRGDLADPRPRLPAPLDPADGPSVAILRDGFISEAERKAILAEADKAAQWAQHYSGYNKHHSWTAFALKGFDPDDPSFIIKPAEMSKQWKAENAERLKARCELTTVCYRFPTVAKILSRIPGERERVRLMRLSAKGGELTRHADITDPDAGTRDGQLCRLHIPLQSHEGCVFRTWDLEGREHRTHLPERALCYLDTRKPHAVVNPESVDRVHLVMDTFATPELRGMIVMAGGEAKALASWRRGQKKPPAKSRGP